MTLTSTWHLVIPIKDRRRGKSRLRPPAGVDRSELAAAMARDTVAAVVQVIPADQVIVVTSDPQLRAEFSRQGLVVLPDPGRGLNVAIESGIAWVVEHAPGQAGAVLLADLPALSADALYEGLRACAATESSVVPDASGQGTVLLTHHDAARLRPSYGAGSAARHGRRATSMPLPLPGLRTDVDDLFALNQAIAIGVGANTRAVLEAASADQGAAS